MGHSGQGVGVGGKVLTSHLLLEPVLEHSHTGVDPRLPWLPASVPPGGDPVQDLLGAGAGLRTGQGASRVTLQGPRERGKREVTGRTHLIAPPLPPMTPLCLAGTGNSELYWGYHTWTHFSDEDTEVQRS